MIALRHRCRKCRGKLPEPTENEHRAFCTRGCWEQFHWTRCICCERPIEQPKRGGTRRWLCNRPKCRSELNKWPGLYRPFEPPKPSTRYPAPRTRGPTPKSPHSTGLETRHESGRASPKAWRQVAGPTLSAESLAAATTFDPNGWAAYQRAERQNRELIDRAAIFQRDTPPANLLGGYWFPNAPQPVRCSADRPPALNETLLIDDGHLSGVPAFLRRDPPPASPKQKPAGQCSGGRVKPTSTTQQKVQYHD
jgi:hypothetical protein